MNIKKRRLGDGLDNLRIIGKEGQMVRAAFHPHSKMFGRLSNAVAFWGSSLQ